MSNKQGDYSRPHIRSRSRSRDVRRFDPAKLRGESAPPGPDRVPRPQCNHLAYERVKKKLLQGEQRQHTIAHKILLKERHPASDVCKLLRECGPGERAGQNHGLTQTQQEALQAIRRQLLKIQLDTTPDLWIRPIKEGSLDARSILEELLEPLDKFFFFGSVTAGGRTQLSVNMGFTMRSAEFEGMKGKYKFSPETSWITIWVDANATYETYVSVLFHEMLHAYLENYSCRACFEKLEQVGVTGHGYGWQDAAFVTLKAFLWYFSLKLTLKRTSNLCYELARMHKHDVSETRLKNWDMSSQGYAFFMEEQRAQEEKYLDKLRQVFEAGSGDRVEARRREEKQRSEQVLSRWLLRSSQASSTRRGRSPGPTTHRARTPSQRKSNTSSQRGESSSKSGPLLPATSGRQERSGSRGKATHRGGHDTQVPPPDMHDSTVTGSLELTRSTALAPALPELEIVIAAETAAERRRRRRFCHCVAL